MSNRYAKSLKHRASLATSKRNWWASLTPEERQRHIAKIHPRGWALKDITGQRFGRWTVLSRGSTTRGLSKSVTWNCRCDCGVEKQVSGVVLRAGRSTSCGCSRMELVGSKHPNWRGKPTKAGYINVNGRIAGRSSARHVGEHIAVMTRMIGRQLRKGETVHHKNGIRSDNRESNLELWAHSHPPGQRVVDLVEWATELLGRYAPERLEAKKWDIA